MAKSTKKTRYHTLNESTSSSPGSDNHSDFIIGDKDNSFLHSNGNSTGNGNGNGDSRRSLEMVSIPIDDDDDNVDTSIGDEEDLDFHPSLSSQSQKLNGRSNKNYLSAHANNSSNDASNDNDDNNSTNEKLPRYPSLLHSPPSYFTLLILTFLVSFIISALFTTIMIRHNAPSTIDPFDVDHKSHEELSKEMTALFNSPKQTTSNSLNANGASLIYLNSSLPFQFLRSDPETFGRYMEYVRGFEVQRNQAYCGLASAAGLLNSVLFPSSKLAVPPNNNNDDSMLSEGGSVWNPTSPHYDLNRDGVLTNGDTLIDLLLDPTYNPYPYATQTNVRVQDCVNSTVLPQKGKWDSVLIPPYGTTLEQIKGVLKCHLHVDYWKVSNVDLAHDTSDVDSFREVIKSALSNKRTRLLANIYRKTLSQPGGGHWSPIVSYDVSTDSVLILDVAKYKLPSYYITVELLYDTVKTVDECGVWDWSSADGKEDGQDRLTEDEKEFGPRAEGWDWEDIKGRLGCKENMRGVVVVEEIV